MTIVTDIRLSGYREVDIRKSVYLGHNLIILMSQYPNAHSRMPRCPDFRKKEKQ